MGQMDAVTAIELEGARRREVALSDARSTRLTSERVTQRTGRVSGNRVGVATWLPALIATVRLARG